MGISRRNRPLFKFIRTFNADLFGNLTSSIRPLKRVELLDFASSGLLGAEFWRLVELLRCSRWSRRLLKNWIGRRSKQQSRQRIKLRCVTTVNKSTNKKIAAHRLFNNIKPKCLRAKTRIKKFRKCNRIIMHLNTNLLRKRNYFRRTRFGYFSLRRSVSRKLFNDVTGLLRLNFINKRRYRRILTDSFGLANALSVARFIVRLLGFCVNEPRFGMWLGSKFSGVVFAMLSVLSVRWGSFLSSIVSLVNVSSSYNAFASHLITRIPYRSRQVRRLFLIRELRYESGRKQGDDESALKTTNAEKSHGKRDKSFGKVNVLGTAVKSSFAIQKKSRVRSDRFTAGGGDSGRGLDLFELRQKLRRFWGSLTLRQLWQYRRRASTKLRGLWERYALSLFECRLDIFLVRSGFFSTVNDARYSTKTGLILVNGKVIPSYRYAVGEGDLVQVWPILLRKFQLLKLNDLWSSLLDRNSLKFRVLPSYLEWSCKRLAVCFVLGQYSTVAIPQLVVFNTTYSTNCGRFQF